MNFDWDFDTWEELIEKIICFVLGIILGCIGTIAVTGLWLAVALWACHSFDLLLTITFSWKLTLLVCAIQWLIRHCFK